MLAAQATPARPVQDRPPAVVTGRVVDADGHPLAYANVRLDSTTVGAATDTSGAFRFTTRRFGPHVLRASSVGFADASRPVTLAAGDTVRVRMTLVPHGASLAEATIRRSVVDVGAGAAMTPTEAVTTPGAAGDLLRALQTQPGVAAPGDGAGLYVRGGDLSETRTLLDGAPVANPYRYSTPASGSFGAVPPFLVEGVSFLTGGFSAQYGNALSGILALETPDRPSTARRYVNLGVAGASVRLDQPLVPGRLGARLSANRSFTGLLFRLNGQQGDYETVPQGWNGTLGLTWDLADRHQLKTTSFVRRHRLAVETAQDNVEAVYRSRTTSQLHVVQWTAGLGAWTLEPTVAVGQDVQTRQFGALDLQSINESVTARVDAERSEGDGIFRAGVLAARRQARVRGQQPTGPAAGGARPIDAGAGATRLGGYVEADWPVADRLRLTTGVRADLHVRPDASVSGPVLDPRLRLQYTLTDATTLRAAWGRYHQFPTADTYGQHAGPDRLGAQRAQHLVAGVHHQQGNWQARLEGYWKPYAGLLVPTGAARYANAGAGYARGGDAFLKYGAFLETPVSGWIAYSFLDAQRTQQRRRGPGVTLEAGPAPFDLTHQLSVVGKAQLAGPLYAGVTYRALTGRPFTPVVDTRRVEGTRYPVEGPVGSRRTPGFHRLDLQLSYYWAWNAEQHAIFYVAVNNVLDRANVTGVTYSADYADRAWQTSPFRRSFYAGVSVTL